MIHIDGSQGEGGGQILRSALALSMALGKPFTISNIRANRPKPGLMRQHMTAVEAAATLCSAKVQGAAPGSRELVFEPGTVRGGTHCFSVGSAGSTTLVLQAILPALLFASERSDITIEGGTHAKWAPHFEFLRDALVPVLCKLGSSVSVTIEKHGFYPAGGGRIRAIIEPGRARGISLIERGEILEKGAEIVHSLLPKSIAERECTRINDRLGWNVGDDSITWPQDTLSPGNVVNLKVRSEHITEVFSAIAEQGRTAERVADDAINDVREYIASDVPVARHLADQLMVPMAIACAKGGETCEFRSLPLTRHATTNAVIVDAFLPQRSEITHIERVRWSIR